MKNIIKKWKERRRQKQQLRELSTVAGAFSTLDRLQESGLLEWNQKLRQLYIEQSLALVMMKDVDSWQHFIQNVFQWQYSKECDRAWTDYFQKEELAAVRNYMAKNHAGKQHGTLSRNDIDRIRAARRNEIAQSDMEPPKVEGFEFFIIAPPELSHTDNTDSTEKPSAISHQPSSQPVGQLVSVGHYDPTTEKMEMALWRDVEHMIKENVK